MPKVSICIPTYNNAQSVRRLLQSIQLQTFSDYEVLITDDSESDQIQILMECFKEQKIQYYKNPKRLGATANWNCVIGKAKGEYIKIMHHDDWFSDENSLEKFVLLLENSPSASMAFSGSYQVKHGTIKERCATDDQIESYRKTPNNLFLGNKIGAPSATIYRNMDIKFDEKLTWLVDVEFYIRLLQYNPVFAYTREPLVSIGLGEEQLTEKCIKNAEINCFEYGYLFDEFGLKNRWRYRSKLIRIYQKYNKKYSDIKTHHITFLEYFLLPFF